jgi:hypothetical protein
MLLFAANAACSGDECLEDLNSACAPLYEPTFQNVFDQTLAPTCGLSGTACHSSEGRQAGLVFAEIEEAHRLLLESRVEPGDASCSLVMRRLESDDPTFQMPPGRKLTATERCAIQQWIQNGATR